MRRALHNSGFSLTEVLMAVAILAVGLLLVGGTFVLGIHYSVVSTEQTVAAQAAQEAFAKIQLRGLVFETHEPGCVQDQIDVNSAGADWAVYPSRIGTGPASPSQYCWRALARNVSDNLVQVTAFVCRTAPLQANSLDLTSIAVSKPSQGQGLQFTDPNGSAIREGSILVDDATGKTYRAHLPKGGSLGSINLDRPWEGTAQAKIWFVSAGPGGRNPCIAVYQTEIRFKP